MTEPAAAAFTSDDLEARVQQALAEHNHLNGQEQALKDQLAAVHDQRLAAQGKVQMLQQLIMELGAANAVAAPPVTAEPESNGKVPAENAEPVAE